MNFTIPTLYYSLSKNYTIDEAYKSLNDRNIFDMSFCSKAIYSDKYGTAVTWLSQVTSEIIEKAEDDLFVVCSSELSFTQNTKNKDICNRIVEAGNNGAQILLGNLDTARDLYKVGDYLYWTDVFFHTSFLVVYKSAFRKITDLLKQEEIKDVCIEQFLISLLDYKFVSYPFLTLNRNFKLGMNNNQTWYNNVTSHFYEGIEAQINKYNEKREQFPYDEAKGYSFDKLL